MALVLLSVAVSACETRREIEIIWRNDTGRTVAYYPVRRGLDGAAPWCPRSDVPDEYYFVEPLPGSPIVDGRIDNSQVAITDLEVVAGVAVDDTFCFPERTDNTSSVTADG